MSEVPTLEEGARIEGDKIICLSCQEGKDVPCVCEMLRQAERDWKRDEGETLNLGDA